MRDRCEMLKRQLPKKKQIAQRAHPANPYILQILIQTPRRNEISREKPKGNSQQPLANGFPIPF